MASQLSRITMNPEICGGRPTVRNLRIRVSDILDLLAAGETRQAILADYPYLEDGDITAALEYASAAASHRVIAASGLCGVQSVGELSCSASACCHARFREARTDTPHYCHPGESRNPLNCFNWQSVD